ncbi:hypothetical protein [Glutamicibacter sp. JC586]|uniref:hypothetical protein n=1 Tax=Glutamicibacter sp. JC586 TaxID=2590552 RepID=UPI0013569513|nr:hypothetical protein [Glutamicibacter sp. JC586]
MVAAVAETSTEQRRAPWHVILGISALVLAAAHLASAPFLAHSPVCSIILLVMTAWCIKCAWCVLHGGSAQRLLLMSAAMGIIHVVMALGMPWFSEHHQHSLHTHTPVHSALMLFLALAEFIVMYGAATYCHIQRQRLLIEP